MFGECWEEVLNWGSVRQFALCAHLVSRLTYQIQSRYLTDILYVYTLGTEVVGLLCLSVHITDCLRYHAVPSVDRK